jgi:hypothetical protein
MWRIYYGNGKTFSSLDGLPEDAPPWNVQLIIQLDEITGRYNQTGDNFYIWIGDKWVGVDQIGLLDYLAHESPSIVKFGRTLSNEDYKKILKVAESDSDFPSRSAWKPTEKWTAKHTQ